ncbi:MBL fold metallo-hydrolase [candidate division WOR-3 bacterium]|nr:MBL fold metallo-hydrolase [candidate division WOR-3 bacterium]
MLFERIESEGLAHYSYIFGHNKEAFVIDPRRDIDIYLFLATRKGYKIKYIFETHRNEDYIIGSRELSEKTGAEIFHADSGLDYRYGYEVSDGQEWKTGSYKIKAIYSPGHTRGSMSYLLFDVSLSPWILFSGDALFAGDVGRVDLLGKVKMKEMAQMLYDTIFHKFFSLGEGVIVCPAHGAGSVCGGEIADRPWTTIGLEQKLNPKLQFTEEKDFIKNISKDLERPYYFKQMERLNVEGAPVLGSLPVPVPLSPGEFSKEKKDAVVLDSRMETDFAGSHVPGSISIWEGGIPAFAGWFLPYDKKILLVNKTDDPLSVVKLLIRIGYDNIAGYLSGGMLSWNTYGKESASIETIRVQNLCELLDKGEKIVILDVRGEEEIKAKGKIPDALNVPVTQLYERMDEVPKEKDVCVFCGSGLRSMMAASLLKKEGWDNLKVALGGLAGWTSNTCPVDL